MKLKIFTAQTMQDALAQVRDTLGDDAVILDNSEEDGIIRITAALDNKSKGVSNKPAVPISSEPDKDRPDAIAVKPKALSLKDLEAAEKAEEFDLEYYLSHHGLPDSLKLSLLDHARLASQDEINLSNVKALSKALKSLFKFEGISAEETGRPIMLVGPPGAGKTVTTARLASRRVLHKKPVRMISTDTIRTGGVAQLRGYGEVLDIDVDQATDIYELKGILSHTINDDEQVLIDTPGFNPFDADEMASLHELITCHDIEPVLVCSAGIDALEAREIAEIYQRLGVKRFITTRLDVARRYASMLCIAETGKMRFAGASNSPYLAQSFDNLTSKKLSEHLTFISERNDFMPQTDEDPDSDIKRPNITRDYTP